MVKKNYPSLTKNVSIESIKKINKTTALENPKIKHDLTKVRILSYNK